MAQCARRGGGRGSTSCVGVDTLASGRAVGNYRGLEGERGKWGGGVGASTWAPGRGRHPRRLWLHRGATRAGRGGTIGGAGRAHHPAGWTSGWGWHPTEQGGGGAPVQDWWQSGRRGAGATVAVPCANGEGARSPRCWGPLPRRRRACAPPPPLSSQRFFFFLLHPLRRSCCRYLYARAGPRAVRPVDPQRWSPARPRSHGRVPACRRVFLDAPFYTLWSAPPPPP